MRKLTNIRRILYKIKISYIINMDNTAEYERIFNMSINDRRQLLKEKDQEFKKEYFAYDNRERARIRRQAKKTDDNSSNITHISQDPILNNNPVLFKQKIDDMFKNAQQNAIISNSNIDIVSEIINNPVNIKEDIIINPPAPKEEKPINNPINNPVNPVNIQKDIINNPPAPIQAPKQVTKPIIDFNDKEVFYQKVVYADLIVANDFCYENGDGGEHINPDTIKEMKNYNIKIPVEYLSEIFIKMPINSNSRMICDTENMYIFL